MWIVPASDLSHAELACLGNNLRPASRRGGTRPSPGRRADRRILAAVNRSLSGLCERVGRLYPRPDDVAGGGVPVPVPVTVPARVRRRVY